MFHLERDFLEDEIDLHINVKEAVAMENSFTLFCENRREHEGTTVVVLKGRQSSPA